MALLNIFKKKKKKAAKKAARKEAPKEVKKPVAVPLKPKKVSAAAYRILKRPHITEKATDLTKINQYVFEVYADANKPEIKKTIESIYGVDVVSLKIIKIPRKKRRLGKGEGWKAGYKKAVARIKEGQKIEVLPR